MSVVEGVIALSMLGVPTSAVNAGDQRPPAIIEQGEMPSRATDRLVIVESAEAPRVTTPEYEVYSTIQDRLNPELREPYFFTLHDRLFGDPAPYFRISYAVTDENYYTKVEASYFQNGQSAVIREGTIPDVHTVKMFPDGYGFLGSTEVDLLIKPDGTLDGPDSAGGQISREQIKESISEHFLLPDDWDEISWDETVGDTVVKRVQYRDAFIVVGGYTNGVIFSYFEPKIPEDTQNPDPSLENPVPTPLPNNLG